MLLLSLFFLAASSSSLRSASALSHYHTGHDLDEAWGAPCGLEQQETNPDLMSDFQLQQSCPPHFFCFWDGLPFKYDNVTGERAADYTWSELQSIIDTSTVDGAGDYKRKEGVAVAMITNGANESVPAQFGYCDCNRFYAFEDPLTFCRTASAGTLFFNYWAVLLICMWGWLLGATVYTIYGFVKSAQFKNNASCQTLLLMFWAIIITILFQLG